MEDDQCMAYIYSYSLDCLNRVKFSEGQCKESISEYTLLCHWDSYVDKRHKIVTS